MELDGALKVVLTKAFESPFKNVVATARTCYSGKGIITDDQIDLDGKRDAGIAKSIYNAGHHTTYQHAQFQFALSGISRHIIWSFFHSHPFYNSEQVSQRYVKLGKHMCYTPPLEGLSQQIYADTIDMQMAAYRELREMLFPVAQDEFFRVFPAKGKKPEEHEQAIYKKTQEVARYVAPVSTLAHMYHTVSGLTLLRYWRACRQADVPTEQYDVVKAMVDAVLAYDPNYAIILQVPLTPDELGVRIDTTPSDVFKDEFDASLEGRVSKLVDYKVNAEETLAQSVREVLGRPKSALNDNDAIRLVLDPAQNRLFSEALNLTTHVKLTRTMHHPSYTFRKKISHTGDSQDQRHRMVPASRPILATQLSDEPDFITPALIEELSSAQQLFEETMNRTWEAINDLKKLGTPAEFADYLLPNAVAIRFTESSDLLNLHHKHRMRLCYNAQEEIWRASVDEAQQIREVNPCIGKYLTPPCKQRFMANATPPCPEGDRYCGVPVWKIGLDEYERKMG